MFMKNTNVKALLKKHKLLGSVAALALTVVIGGSAFFQNAATIVPEFPEITDPVMEVSIEDEETPLASTPKVTTKTTTKTTKKNVKLSKAATKTYTKKLPVTTKTTTKKKMSSKSTVTTQTTVKTAVTEKYTKKSKTKVVTTKVTTTVKTTTVTKEAPKEEKTYTAYTSTADKLAPKMDSRVIKAYNTLNFKINVNPNVNYSGYFDARNQLITLNAKQMDMFPDTVYHELGHFLAFIAGNVDTKADYVAIYNKEKETFTGVNKAYAIQSSSEFFAECVRVYTMEPDNLKKMCPKTYDAIEKALNSVTDVRVEMLKKVYAAYWKY